VTDKFWKTIVTVEVLTRGKTAPEYDSLDAIAYDITNGEASGYFTVERDEVSPDRMIHPLEAQGSDPSFLGLTASDDTGTTEDGP